MREQVGDGDLARGFRIGKAERRNVGGHRRVHAQLPFVRHELDDERRECLGGGGIGEERVRVDGVLGAELSHAEPFREHHGVVFHDRDREPGHVPVFHAASDVGVEAGEWGLRVCGEGEQGEREDGGARGVAE